MKRYFEPSFVKALFDKMSSSYSRMNYVTSFGFSARWRRQCVQQIQIPSKGVVVDLLSGMGECWRYIIKNSDSDTKIVALDFSAEMTARAMKNKNRFSERNIQILEENVFENTIEGHSADCVISGFGLKTFDDNQLRRLAMEINRILKTEGTFSLVDISVPKNSVLRVFYMLYLKYFIPVLGFLFLGNPETYKMLGVSSMEFGNATKVKSIFQDFDFELEYVEYFFGCESGIKGTKT